jgi:hypothetical protein
LFGFLRNKLKSKKFWIADFKKVKTKQVDLISGVTYNIRSDVRTKITAQVGLPSCALFFMLA